MQQCNRESLGQLRSAMWCLAAGQEVYSPWQLQPLQDPNMLIDVGWRHLTACRMTCASSRKRLVPQMPNLVVVAWMHLCVWNPAAWSTGQLQRRCTAAMLYMLLVKEPRGLHPGCTCEIIFENASTHSAFPTTLNLNASTLEWHPYLPVCASHRGAWQGSRTPPAPLPQQRQTHA
mmetsp:Transcript_77218/g.213532  ORF Transcript_77218/g.213532 Transcript_77218/m.213532 type:complete len:175 (+) Transcript_77218:160-684(+)